MASDISATHLSDLREFLLVDLSLILVVLCIALILDTLLLKRSNLVLRNADIGRQLFNDAFKRTLTDFLRLSCAMFSNLLLSIASRATGS